MNSNTNIKELWPVYDYNELPDNLSPFSQKTLFITCTHGCNKQLLTKSEYQMHRCVDHLKNVIREQHKENKLLHWHLDQAENDFEDLVYEYERCKESQEAAIDELKQKLYLLQQQNETLIDEKARKSQDYDNRLCIEKHNSEKEATLGFMNFIQTAEKDFNLLCQRLNSDFSKYNDKVNDEAVTYQLKTQTNLMTKQKSGKKKTSKLRSGSLTPKSGSTTLRSGSTTPKSESKVKKIY